MPIAYLIALSALASTFGGILKQIRNPEYRNPKQTGQKNKRKRWKIPNPRIRSLRFETLQEVRLISF